MADIEQPKTADGASTVATTKSVVPTAPHLAIRFGLCSTSNEQNTAPVIDYIEDVESFLTKQNMQDRADEVIEEINRLYKGLKIHQQKIYSERLAIQRRLPDLKENIKIIKVLREQQQVNLRFMAADSLWVDGVVDHGENGTVALWLGAEVMMEYPYDEAEDLLANNVAKSQVASDAKLKELLFLKEQLTMCEVTLSRFYNYEVARKRKLKAAEEKGRRNE